MRKKSQSTSLPTPPKQPPEVVPPEMELPPHVRNLLDVAQGNFPHLEWEASDDGGDWSLDGTAPGAIQCVLTLRLCIPAHSPGAHWEVILQDAELMEDEEGFVLFQADSPVEVKGVLRQLAPACNFMLGQESE